MFSFSSLNFGLLILLMKSRSTFSEDIVYRNLKKIVASEMENLNKVLGEIEISEGSATFERSILRDKLSILNSKLEQVLSEVKENKKISEESRNISRRVTFCKANIEESETCTDLAKEYLSVVHVLFYANVTQHTEITSNLGKCFKNLPKTMEGHTYFVSPKLDQGSAVAYCEEQGGKVFIPQTQEEFLFYVAVTVEPKTGKYSWYPVNDINMEGHLVLQDGTDYEKASYKLRKWDSNWQNSAEADCATIDLLGLGSWSKCSNYEFVLLCQKN